MLRYLAPMALAACDSISLNLVSAVRGTMVATPRGEVPVEVLNVGDLVTGVDGDVSMVQPILWSCSGVQQAKHMGGIISPLVRVRAGALRPGMPASDLLLTEGQCIVTDRGCIAAEALVNGGSIVAERPAKPYEYFYLAFAQHRGLLLNGLLSRSTISIGKRPGAPGPTGPTIRQDGKVFGPFWRRLAHRHAGLNHLEASSGHVVDDSRLRLLLDGGQEIPPGSVSEGCFVFHIPRSRRPLALLSPIRRQSGDGRLLGVAVEGLLYQGSRFSCRLEADALDLEGWYGLGAGFRWTNGMAKIDLLPQASDDETFLTVRLLTDPVFATQAAEVSVFDTIQNA